MELGIAQGTRQETVSPFPVSTRKFSMKRCTMPAEEITSSVEVIEVEAEKMLEDAQNRAAEIILKAKEEANAILASEVSLDEVKGECEQTLDKAREKAAREPPLANIGWNELRGEYIKQLSALPEDRSEKRRCRQGRSSVAIPGY